MRRSVSSLKGTSIYCIAAILALFALFCPSLAFGQAANYQTILLSGSGRPVNANVAICTTGLSSVGASVTNNIGTLVFGTNPQTSGFIAGKTLTVSAFTGGDTYLNGTYTILAVSPSTVSFLLVHADSAAATIGLAFQTGDALTPCAPLATIFTDYTAATIRANPFVSGSLGNVSVWANSGIYQMQTYGQQIVTTVTAFSIGGTGGGGGGGSFGLITTGTNTTTLIVGTGGSLIPSGSGVIQATSLQAFTVATLPVGVVAGTLVEAIDSFTAGDCVIGGGAQRALCRWNGAAWEPIGDGTSSTSPAGVSGDVQLNNGVGGLGVGGINDNGTTVKVTRDSQFTGPNPGFDVRASGARFFPSPASSTTATCTNGSTTIVLAAIIDFINGDGFVGQQCGPATALSTPAAPSSVNQRAVANGATTRSYKIVAEDFSLGLTAASAATSSAVTAATLGSVNTATLSSKVTASGITTFTTVANHNLAVGALILIGVNGLEGQVLTTPAVNTFTLRVPGAIDQASTTATGSVNVASHVQVYWTGQPNVMRYWIYRQDGGAGNFNLIGVAQGSEPFYDDYGWPAPTAPAYVSATAPASATNQSLATKIVSGAGTVSIVVANAASNSIGGVQALHDNTVAMQAAYAAVTTAVGGRIYVPKPAVNNSTLVFNFPMKFTGGGPVPTEIELAGRITANQPIVPASQMTFTGVADNTSFTPAFGKNFYSFISGTGYPLILIQGTKSSILFDHVYVYPASEQQWGILSDNTFGAGGATDIYAINSYLTCAKASGGAVVLRGVGFNYGVLNNVIGNQNAVFYSQGGLRLMGSFVSSPTGIPGIGMADTNTLLAVGFKADTEALNGSAIANAGSPWTFQNTFTEALVQPLFDFRNIVSNFWFNWRINRLSSADSATLFVGLDMTGSTGLDGLYIDGTGAGTGGFSFIAGGSKGISYTEGSLFDAVVPSPGYADLSYRFVNIGSSSNNFRIYETDGGLRLKPGGIVFAEPPAPTNLSGAVAAGGSIPVGTWTYRIVSVGWNGGESAPSNVTLPLVVTGGNQTVNLTWNASGIGTQGYYVYRANGGGYARVTSSVITTTSYSDVLASIPGQSMPTASGTGPSYLNSTEVSAPQFRVASQSGLFSSVIKGTFTANQTITVPDASGTLGFSSNVPSADSTGVVAADAIIQAAINNLSPTVGGDIHVSKGHYLIHTGLTSTGSGVHIICEGNAEWGATHQDTTVLQTDAAINILTVGTSGSLQHSGIQIDNCTFRDIGGIALGGLLIQNTNRNTLTRVGFEDFATAGSYGFSITNLVGGTFDASYNNIYQPFSRNNDTGIRLNSPQTNIYGGEADGNTYGIDCQSGQLFLNGTNIETTTTSTGINLTCSDSQINAHMEGAAGFAGNTGILVNSGASRNHISGSATKFTTAINLAAGSFSNVVDMTGMQNNTTPITDAGNGNLIIQPNSKILLNTFISAAADQAGLVVKQQTGTTSAPSYVFPNNGLIGFKDTTSLGGMFLNADAASRACIGGGLLGACTGGASSVRATNTNAWMIRGGNTAGQIDFFCDTGLTTGVNFTPSNCASISKTALVLPAATTLTSTGVVFASLGAPANGNFIYCSDCTIANPCAGGGTGALAKRLNGVWVCN